ncbi:AAA family ATPase [uncultured Eubacterium sp.]|uniref:AAA family ATPase n=1 Tax=uncultured Eubacterium sp. TaxID=165185 RepID=UPI0025CC722E|nr:AAA family ATPase [uncultured Eubacterium sp.]MCI6537020.1 ATP-binding protein [Lachnospiraceae bacterium]
MERRIAIGIQRFDTLRENNYFYIDKTDFIREWWEAGDAVTLITRPRRFGKTLNMSMVEQFFSQTYAEREDLFQGLKIWQEDHYQKLQGTYPVISVSFANVKDDSYANAYRKICQLISDIYARHSYLLKSELLQESDRMYFRSVRVGMDEATASMALYKLSDYMYRYYGRNVIILLDEYDTPMQEAYVGGFWPELTNFIRNLLNATFKTNPWLERALLTGITRVSNESIFSDLNHLKVVTTTSEEYADSFGFSEAEVFAAMDEYGYTQKEEIKRWYDGFAFGSQKDIYNPWSILNYLDTGKVAPYWANTSSNHLVGKLIQEGSREIKISFERLLNGKSIRTTVEEQIAYEQLDMSERAVWSLLLASGYMKVLSYEKYDPMGESLPEYELTLTNLEVRLMFRNMVTQWFSQAESDYNDFLKALLLGDVDAMNEYMNRVALVTFSSFDTGKHPSVKSEPERFYHGFVLGLMVNLQDRYYITSNRESGFGRYDILLEPKHTSDDAIIIEFKVQNIRREKNLEDTLRCALQQIEEKKYDTELLKKGISPKRIRKYGFAFFGKEVLIG